jgi:hypothetical protein
MQAGSQGGEEKIKADDEEMMQENSPFPPRDGI